MKLVDPSAGRVAAAALPHELPLFNRPTVVSPRDERADVRAPRTAVLDDSGGDIGACAGRG
jgi:hypothetical protein